jgi:DNA repair exonuclease SbcCD ATPase subunit
MSGQDPNKRDPLLSAFANKLSEFSQNLRNATEQNKAVVEDLDREVSGMKTAANSLYSLLVTTLDTLKKSVKEVEKTGVSTSSLQGQIKVLEGLLNELNIYLGAINGNNTTSKNIRSNIEAIKQNLKKQEELLKSSTSGQTKPSTGILGDIAETMFGGFLNKRSTYHKKRSSHKKHALHRTMRKHHKKN